MTYAYMVDRAGARKSTNTKKCPGPFMIAIILSTCLVTDPTVCLDHKIPLSLEISAIQCMEHAQPYVAQWSEEHRDGG
jgi:hypothetical protein